MKNGLTWPNAQWRVFTPQEEAAILELQPAAVLALGYSDSSCLTEKIAQEARLWEQLGRPMFLLRPYSENIIDKHPGEWAETCYRLLAQYEQAHVRVSGLICANEFNVEGGFEDWDRQADWLERFVNVIRPLVPFVDLHLPALSPHGNYLDGHVAYILADLADYFDVVDVHGYSLMDLTDVPGLANLYGKPVAVTEYNRINPIDCIDYLSQFEACEMAAWFILSGEVSGGEDQRQHWLIDKPELYEAFKTAGQGIGHEFPQPPTDGAIWPVYEGENMDQATINRLWGDYLSFPAFARFRAEHPELGDALEDRERDYGIYRVKFFAGGIIGARVGDWENIAIWTSKDQLPPLT